MPNRARGLLETADWAEAPPVGTLCREGVPADCTVARDTEAPNRGWCWSPTVRVPACLLAGERVELGIVAARRFEQTPRWLMKASEVKFL